MYIKYNKNVNNNNNNNNNNKEEEEVNESFEMKINVRIKQ